MNRAVLLAIAGFILLPQPAAANVFLEFFFPSLRVDESAPTASGHAPFARQAGESQELAEEAQEPDVSQMPLDQKHRRSEDVAEWLEQVVSEALTFKGLTIDRKAQELDPFFSESGTIMYRKFLQDMDMERVIASAQYDIRGIAKETPAELNAGVADGLYSWLFEVPVMISYVPSGVEKYDKDLKPVNQEVTIRIQAGRMQSPETDIGVEVTRWEIATVKN